MEKNTERLIVPLSREMLMRIEDYRRILPERIPPRVEAIRDLIDAGLKVKAEKRASQ